MKKKLCLFFCFICLYGCYREINIDDKSQDHKNIETSKGDEEMLEGYITINEQEFDIHFYDNETVNQLFEQLPITITMNDLHGNEKYYYFQNHFSTNSESVNYVEAGDVMLFQENCLVIFYESFNTSYQYTKLGYIENAAGFKEVLGDGQVQVSIQGGKR